ncbi:MAG: SpoIVB peptidase S55 [Acidobacteriota bacterium]|nr:SpoIVB peptidase S55 [Acidobacteriota bacterium]
MLALALGMVTAAAMPAAMLAAQTPATRASSSPPKQTRQSGVANPRPPAPGGGFFPLSQVRRGMTATAWTVFTGTKPEPMEVEILGVLRGARGPGQDMILAQLRGAKPEYTGVVEGMSGSPVYIGNKLLGALAYRIGQFSKDPIAGITPIEQMLEVNKLPGAAAPPAVADGGRAALEEDASVNADGGPHSNGPSDSGPMDGNTTFQAMETPLVMSGFRPEAIRMWQQKMAGTSLDMVAAGGMDGASATDTKISASAVASLEPGSSVSAQLVRGDEEIAATCTVTYVDAKHLLACGHPILQAGPVSLPMTTADVLATLASPLNAFKIINTGATVGAITQDRESAILGILGAQARMIPMHITVDGPGERRKVNVEILDQPSLTPQAMQVVLYNALIQANGSTASTSYHLTGNIDMEGYPPSPLDMWVSAGGAMPSSMEIALLAGERFTQFFTNGAREGSVRAIDLHVEAIPRYVRVQLESARLVSNDVVHAGDTIEVEATIRPWRQPERNIRIPVTLPARLGAGGLRLLVSDAGTLDRTLNQPSLPGRTADLATLLAEARRLHTSDRIYVSLLMPEAQAGMDGQTLSSLPLSVANALEPLRTGQDVNLNGESAVVVGELPAGGVLSGYEILKLHIEQGGGLH